MKEDTHFTDTEIIQRILAGHTALFEILIRRNNPFLYKIGRTYNYSHEDTQDLMQETFIDAYIHLDRFESRSSFKTWLIRLMLNNCYRKQQRFSVRFERTEQIDEAAVPVFSDPENKDTTSTVMNRELNRVIEQALAAIPADYRIVFSLREMNGLNVRETAALLKISEENVKVRLNRSKAMLRKEIEKSYNAQEIFEFNLVYCDRIVTNVMGRIAGVKGKEGVGFDESVD